MKKRIFISLLIGFAVSAISLVFDDKIMGFISSIRNGYLDSIFLSVCFAGNVFVVFFFLTTLFLWKEKKRRWILPLWISGIISGILSFLLKIIFRRPRPFEEGLLSILGIIFHFMKNNFNTWNFSFPSFQAMFVFSAVPILNREFKKLGHIWLVFAILVMLSRVYFGAHYLSDALIGALIGYFIGYIMVLVEEKYGFGLRTIKKISL